jgi:RNA polymerase sigma-70 factor (ECF subfamily)
MVTLYPVPGKKMNERLDAIDENEIIELAIAGDKDAFGVLYETHIKKIYNYIYYRTGNSFDAEDLTERVFYRALRHIKNYNNQGLPFSAWLYRIAHNLVANWHRDNSRKKEIPIEDKAPKEESQVHPEISLIRSEEQDNLLLIIRKLPEDRQQLLILKFVERLSNSEIGLIMDKTEGAVKSLYHRTLLSIRDELTLLSLKDEIKQRDSGDN